MLDNGIPLFDLGRWYESHLPRHDLMAELLEQSWQVTPFHEIPETELEALSELVELSSEGRTGCRRSCARSRKALSPWLSNLPTG